MTGTAEEWTWPVFSEPELVERLLMQEPRFLELWLNMLAQMPVRDFSEEAFTLGTGYPWPRPGGSFVLSEDKGQMLGALDPDRRIEAVEEFTGVDSGRVPMLAIGSNASPEGLWRKFGHFEDPADRTLLALHGRLHDFDIGATAELALYGALPATIFPSPGTRAEAMVLWLTPVQLTQLTWAEIPYWLGRLDTPFETEPEVADLGPAGFEQLLVYVNRFGCFAPDGHPFALAAIAADQRTVPALGQIELLDRVAALALGPDADARELVRRAFAEPAEVGALVTEVMVANAIPFESDRWNPFPG